MVHEQGVQKGEEDEHAVVDGQDNEKAREEVQ